MGLKLATNEGEVSIGERQRPSTFFCINHKIVMNRTRVHKTKTASFNACKSRGSASCMQEGATLP